MNVSEATRGDVPSRMTFGLACQFRGFCDPALMLRLQLSQLDSHLQLGQSDYVLVGSIDNDECLVVPGAETFGENRFSSLPAKIARSEPSAYHIYALTDGEVQQVRVSVRAVFLVFMSQGFVRSNLLWNDLLAMFFDGADGLMSACHSCRARCVQVWCAALKRGDLNLFLIPLQVRVRTEYAGASASIQ